MTSKISKRKLLIGGGSLFLGSLITANRSALSHADGYRPLLRMGENFNMHAQRLALHNRPLAPEYRVDQISPTVPQNGGFGATYIDPDPHYDHLVATGFKDWRLSLDGLVDRPMTLSIDQIRKMPSRTQITMHSCDAGWSAIGQWTGVQLRALLDAAGLQDKARYVVFYCMDKIAGQGIYGSIDLLDAYHPQTILAHSLNGEPLPTKNGAPLRLRVELQIGYKNLKHINRISVVESLDNIGGGAGGLFEDMGYQWYAGL
jgi:DMSO/TMAO reductase YedYZ molybdopterin-dependent catalytic subunit